MFSRSDCVLILGSARASRAGDRALAIANLYEERVSMVTQKLFRRGAETGTRGACAPQIFGFASCAILFPML